LQLLHCFHWSTQLTRKSAGSAAQLEGWAVLAAAPGLVLAQARPGAAGVALAVMLQALGPVEAAQAVVRVQEPLLAELMQLRAQASEAVRAVARAAPPPQRATAAATEQESERRSVG